MRQPDVHPPTTSYEEDAVELHLVDVEKPADLNVIVGQAHFIKTVDDLFQTLAMSAPGLRFGIALCEASGERLIRRAGNDEGLVAQAVRTAEAIAAGHVFVVFLADAYPVNVLNAVKQVPEVCRVFCATANPLQLVVAESALGRGVLGVIDGETPLGTETDAHADARRDLVRRLGYAP
jgi:adenosine/AMP kinase